MDTHIHTHTSDSLHAGLARGPRGSRFPLCSRISRSTDGSCRRNRHKSLTRARPNQDQTRDQD